jgi:hypothetical protein
MLASVCSNLAVPLLKKDSSALEIRVSKGYGTHPEVCFSDRHRAHVNSTLTRNEIRRCLEQVTRLFLPDLVGEFIVIAILFSSLGVKTQGLAGNRATKN